MGLIRNLVVSNLESEVEVVFDMPNTDTPCTTLSDVVGDFQKQALPLLVTLHGRHCTGHEYLMSSITDIYEQYDVQIVFYD